MSVWLRLDVDWDRARWMRGLTRAEKHTWPDLLRHVKVEGPKRGAVKFRDVEDLAYAMRYSVEEIGLIAKMLEAAQVPDENGESAIVIEGGNLTVIKWHEFQSTEAERSRRFRDAQTVSTALGNGDTQDETVVEDKPVSSGSTTVSNDLRNGPLSCVTSNQQPVTETDLKPTVLEEGAREEKTKRKPKEPPVDRWENAPNLNDFVPESHRSDRLREVWQKFVQHRKARRVDPYTSGGIEAVWSHLRNQGYTRDMIPGLIERCMAQNWKGLPPEEIDRYAQLMKQAGTTALAKGSMNTKIDDMTAEIIRRTAEREAELNAA